MERLLKNETGNATEKNNSSSTKKTLEWEMKMLWKDVWMFHKFQVFDAAG